MIRRIAALCFLGGLWATQAAAQQQQQTDTFIETVKVKNALTDEERNQLNSWIETRVGAIATGGGAAGAGELRAAAQGAAQGFRDLYIDMLLQAIGPVYPRIELSAAAQLLSIVAALDDVRAADVFIQALGDQRVAVRTAAAVGLRRLRQQIARNPDAVARALAALRDAGQRESSPVALKTIYSAIDLSAADPGRTAAALLDVLEARSSAYMSSQVDAWGADREGLRLARRLKAQYADAALRARLIKAAAGIILPSVVRYANELSGAAIAGENRPLSPVERQLRDDTEIQIELADQILRELIQPPGGKHPLITEAMRGSGAFDQTDPTAMKRQMNEWATLLQAETGEDFSTARIEG